jgi:DNA-binding XRE family transcriptional regulator
MMDRRRFLVTSLGGPSPRRSRLGRMRSPLANHTTPQGPGRDGPRTAPRCRQRSSPRQARQAPQRQRDGPRPTCPQRAQARLLDIQAAADYLSVSMWTIRDLEAAGELPRVRLTLPWAQRGTSPPVRSPRPRPPCGPLARRLTGWASKRHVRNRAEDPFTEIPLDGGVTIGYTPRMTPREFKRLRQQAGLTQAETAERLGVTRVAVARWEIGDRRIPEMAARLLARICDEERRRG